jgi:hypothetical protein
MSKCQRCKDGPRGPEGHQDLYVNKMSGGPMQFRCRACGSLWMRRQSGGHLEWADAVGDEAGATVPQAAKGED